MPALVGSPAPDIELLDYSNQPTRLSALWMIRPLILIFIRHLGCPLCRAHVVEVRNDFAQFEQAGCEVAVVAMGTVPEVAAFRSDLQLPFRMLADPDQHSYRLYGLPRGSIGAIAGPKVWLSGLRAVLSLGVGKVIGDPYQLPGSFVIDKNGVVRLAHHAANSADWLKTADLVTAVRGAQ